ERRGILGRMNEPEASESSAAIRGISFVIKVAIFVTGLAILFAIYYFNRDLLSLKSLAQKETELIDFQKAHPVWVFVLAYLIYTVVTGFSLPGAAVMTLLYGWFFQKAYDGVTGLAVGFAVVSFASTSGATIAFLISRFLLRDAIQNKFGDRLVTFNEALRREGAFYLFSLRLIPAVPFFVINVVMGLTPIRIRTYWWVSQLGMFPGTIVYVYAGTTLPGPADIVQRGASGFLSWQLFIAFAVLGLFPLVLKRIVAKVRGGP
ncbi:MAG: TVP38/TMEM64 family protein, partial [Planctomycetales bacterium]